MYNNGYIIIYFTLFLQLRNWIVLAVYVWEMCYCLKCSVKVAMLNAMWNLLVWNAMLKLLVWNAMLKLLSLKCNVRAAVF